jgi:hypothetical protein
MKGSPSSDKSVIYQRKYRLCGYIIYTHIYVYKHTYIYISSYDEMRGLLACIYRTEMNIGFGMKKYKKDTFEGSAQNNIKNGPERW